MTDLLFTLFYCSVIVFSVSNLIFLLSPIKGKDQVIPIDEGVPYPKPYQPPNKVEKPKGDPLPIHQDGDWVYDPNVNYRPRSVEGSQKKLTRLG